MPQSASATPEVSEPLPESATSGVMRRAPPSELPPESALYERTPEERAEMETVAEAVRLAARAGLWEAVEVLTQRFPRWR